jgi:hypothetical protein
VSLLLALLALAAWELVWRSQGFQPSLADDGRLWAAARERASTRDPGAVALLGSSLIQAAVDLEVLAEEAGAVRPLQLGLTNSTPVPVLEDLAADTDFVGVALVEVSPLWLFDASGEAERLPRERIAEHRAFRVAPSQRSEQRLASLVQERAVFRLSVLSPANLARSLWRGEPPTGNPLRVGRDRSIRFDSAHPATRVPQALVQGAHGRLAVLEGAALDAVVARLAAAAGAIRARGGEVGVVSLACQGPYRDQVESRYPLARYWSRVTTAPVLEMDLAARPELAALPCPDGVHLDERGREPFSRALGGALRAHLHRASLPASGE